MKEGYKTSIRRIRYVFICMGLALLLVNIVLPASVGYSAQKSFEGDRVLPEYYPARFDGGGPIDRITEDEAVIGDMLWKLSPDVRYHTPSIENASSAWFKEGKFVGYITNSRREIVSLWLIE